VLVWFSHGYASASSGRSAHGAAPSRDAVLFRSADCCATGRVLGDSVNKLTVLGFLIVATTLEAFGDAIVRMGLNQHSLAPRALLFFAGAVLLFGYGLSLNLAPIEFGRVVGLYIGTLFVVWQIVNFVAFRSLPTVPILLGGALIIAGGSIVTFWQR
jgi:hypothetical protein